MLLRRELSGVLAKALAIEPLLNQECAFFTKTQDMTSKGSANSLDCFVSKVQIEKSWFKMGFELMTCS